MRPVKGPSCESLAVYDALTSQKRDRRTCLEALRARIACAYKRYQMHAPNLERCGPLGRRVSEEERSALKYCYDSADELRAEVRKVSYVCVYCGVLVATTLDHYLPKAGLRGFPELSVLPVNLLPSCADCNRPRDFRDRRGRRALVHPYFDQIEDVRMLFAKLTVRHDVPDVKFCVKLAHCSDRNSGKLFVRHVELLGLRRRFRVHAMASDGPIAGIMRTVRAFVRSRETEAVRNSLRNYAHLNQVERGANHFETALWFGAAESEDFIQYLVERI